LIGHFDPGDPSSKHPVLHRLTVGPQSFLSADGALSAQAPVVPPPCNDNNACTADQCVGGGTAVAFCRDAPVPTGTSCDDDNSCNGIALCDGAGTCQPGVTATAGTSCADGTVCNGDETCDGSGTCAPGTPPVVSDSNACTADTCDAVTGVSHVALPDGTSCNGSGVCEAGSCSIQAHTLFAITGAVTPLASAGPVIDYGMTYDPVIDRFWVVDTAGQIMQFDPGNGFARTLLSSIPGPHTCIASVPVGL
jgi:hypothetical protein